MMTPRCRRLAGFVVSTVVAGALFAAGPRAAAGQEPLLLNCGVSLPEYLPSVDRYLVEVPDGAVVAINVFDTSGTIGLIKLRAGDQETCAGTLELTEPGAVTVEVSDCLGTGDVGTYTITANIVSQNDSNCAHPLPCGATLRVQQFTVAGEVDAYTFVGAPGDQVTVTAMDVSGTIGFVRLRVYDPDGVMISGADSCRSSNKVLTLTKSGTYTALMNACGLPTTGAYGVAFESTACPSGPDITYFGIAGPDGVPHVPDGYFDDGRPQYVVPTGSEFSLVIEGRPGRDGQPVGIEAFAAQADDPNVLPDLQVLLSRALGDGSPIVCDHTPPSAGGVPATDPLEYAGTQAVADAINDFGCLIDDGSGVARGVTESTQACTRLTAENAAFVDPTSTTQFCAPILAAWSFPPRSSTIVRARLRDAQGALGADQEMVVTVRSQERICPSDCNDDHRVRIPELVLAVNIALGNKLVDACPAVDVNRDGSVQINEVVQGMNSLMSGCPPR